MGPEFCGQGCPATTAKNRQRLSKLIGILGDDAFVEIVTAIDFLKAPWCLRLRGRPKPGAPFLGEPAGTNLQLPGSKDDLCPD